MTPVRESFFIKINDSRKGVIDLTFMIFRSKIGWCVQRLVCASKDWFVCSKIGLSVQRLAYLFSGFCIQGFNIFNNLENLVITEIYDLLIKIVKEEKKYC